MIKSEQQAIDNVIDHMLNVLRFHPELSSYDPSKWYIEVNGFRMNPEVVMEMELRYEEEDNDSGETTETDGDDR